MPPDQSELNKRIREAKAAEQFLDNDLFKGAIAALRRRALEEFQAAEPGDAVALSTARLRYMVTEDLVNEIYKVVTEGQLAETKLEIQTR